jgi:hypothetical protein
MFLQAHIDLADLARFLAELTPLAVDLSDTNGPLSDLRIERPEGIGLVPDRGLRVLTSLRFTATIAGVRVPVTASSAQLLLVPAIAARGGHAQLVFSVEVEAIDLRHVPAMLDATILERVNEALAKDAARPAWDFLKTLSFGFAMPARMEPVTRITLKATDGKVRVTEAGLDLTVPFEAHALRA